MEYPLYKLAEVLQCSASQLLCVAQGGSEQRRCFVGYTTAGTLVVRIQESPRNAIVKRIKYEMQVMSLSVDATAQWVLVVNADMTIVVIPVYYLLVKKMYSESSALELHQGKTNSRAASKSKISSLLRIIPLPKMHSSSSRRDPAEMGAFSRFDDATVISTFCKQRSSAVVDCVLWRGQALIVFSTGVLHRIDLDQCLLLGTLQLAQSVTKLELFDNDKLLIHTKSNGCSMLLLETLELRELALFSQFNVISTQILRSTPVICCIDSKDNQLHIFDASLSSQFPLFIYRLPPGTLHVSVGQYFLFAADNERIHVISTLHQQVFQSIKLQRSSGMKYFLNRFQFWTVNGLCELTPDADVRTLFYQLMAQGLGASQGELLATAAGLDVLRLYERAADHFYEKKEYGRALELYFLSHFDAFALALRFLKIGRVDVVISFCNAELRDKEPEPALSKLLLICYLTQCVQDNDETRLRAFLESDLCLDDGHMAQQLLDFGYIECVLRLFHARDAMANGLQFLLANGVTCLRASEQDFLFSQRDKHYELLMIGPMFSSLPANVQVGIVQQYAVPLTLPFFYDTLCAALPSLGSLDSLEDYLCPDTPRMKSVSGESDVLRVLGAIKDFGGAKKKWPCKSDWLELYMKVLIQICATRGADHPLGKQATEEKKEESSGPDEAASSASSTVVEATCISCGWQKSAALSKEGHVYTWEEDNTATAAVEFPVRFGAVFLTRVACGGAHIVVLDRVGRVFSWGDNEHGQLGHGGTSSRREPTLVQTMGDVLVRDVATGYGHTCFLDSIGCAWACGLNEDSQCGQDKRFIESPLRMRYVEGGLKVLNVVVLGIAVGFAHTAVWTEEGEVYTTGNNMYGQLGYQTDLVDVGLRKVSGELSNKFVEYISCGYGHTSVVAAGSVYEWGRGDAFCKVAGLEGRKIVKLAAGKLFTCALSDRGELFCWERDGVLRVPVRGASDMDCGRATLVALCRDGSLYSWGEQGGHAFSLQSGGGRQGDHMSSHSWPSECCGQRLARVIEGVTGYRPLYMAKVCLRHGCVEAAAKIYETHGHLSLALHVLLKQRPSVEVLDRFSEQPIDLEHLILWWPQQEMPTLHKWIASRASVLSAQVRTMLECRNETLMKLPQSLLLRLVGECLLSSQSTPQASAMEQRLLQSITSNLSKDVELRAFLDVPSSSVENHPEAVVFTCGHVYSKHTFFSVILPQFKRAKQFPRITESVILAQYSRGAGTGEILLSCPKCIALYDPN